MKIIYDIDVNTLYRELQKFCASDSCCTLPSKVNFSAWFDTQEEFDMDWTAFFCDYTEETIEDFLEYYNIGSVHEIDTLDIGFYNVANGLILYQRF